MKTSSIVTELPDITLHTIYPCCGGRARILALVDIPREVYDRRCPRCGKQWCVERRIAVMRYGARIDILEWEPRFVPDPSCDDGQEETQS